MDELAFFAAAFENEWVDVDNREEIDMFTSKKLSVFT